MRPLTRRRMLRDGAGLLVQASFLRAQTRTTGATTFDIRDFGAKADGRTVNTVAIQKAIDACALQGGTVLVSSGQYVTGTLSLKSNVTMHLEARASLLGSPSIDDYRPDAGRNMYAHEPQLDRCLIFAQGATNIGIEGKGSIDGHGASFPNQNDPVRNRPMLLRLIDCTNVFVKDLTLQNPAAWTCAFLYCNDVRVDGINILSRIRDNGDGLDFDGCQNVRVTNCHLDNSDDSICLQCSNADKPVRDVVITNCIMTSKWAALRIGLLSRGLFENVTVSNCVFHDIEGEAIKIQLAEGGRMQNMLFSNIVMRNVPRPVFVTFNSFPFLVDAPNPLPPMQTLQDITFDDIRIDGGEGEWDGRNSFIALLGLPDHPIENLTLSNIRFTAPGGGTKEEALRQNVPELLNMRPEREPLGATLPAYGIFARHIRGLNLNNITLASRQRDLRPAILCDDVQDLRLTAVVVKGDAEVKAIVLKDASDALIESSSAMGTSLALLRLEGSRSARIGIVANDLRNSIHGVDLAEDLPKGTVTMAGNLMGS